MTKLLAKWIIISLSVLLAAYIIPGITVASSYTAIITALFLGLFNALVRPILVVLTLPINILTLGLFIFVINALILLFLSTFIKGFVVDSFWTAFLGALLISAASWLGNNIFKTVL
ncbi:MAG: phage holin family protein [Candidatus Moranbacteria bacterium]|nr:phage holin family protein [Candidatus Moranbacteria bacterium]